MRLSTRLLAIIVCAFLTVAAAAQSVELRLKDGSRWRGKVGDQVTLTFMQQGVEITMQGKIAKTADMYVVVDGQLAGVARQKTIMKSDIVSVTSAGEQTGAAELGTTSSGADAAPVQPGATPDVPSQPAAGRKLGVFYLPMSGMVGEGMRHEEIEAIGREADKYGPGQIIILHINSGGGLGIEMEQLHFTVVNLRKRHRVIAWIKEAISAAAATAINCNEIYFMRTGTLGSMTGYAGTRSLQGEELRKWMEAAGRWMQEGGREPCIAWAMIEDQVELSYDKDPVTGKVTWHCDLSGEFVLSHKGENLTFTEQTARHSGFSRGTADTQEELAKLLDLPEWREISDYGRKISRDWLATVETAKQRIPLLAEELEYKGTGSGDAVVILGKRKQIIEELIDWWRRCPNACFLMGVPPKEELEGMVLEIRKQIADIKKRQN